MDNDSADVAPLEQRFAFGRKAPWISRTSTTRLCNTCLRNQHLYIQCLSQYDIETDESSPDFATSEAQYKKYVADLELRYPQVCEDCAPRAYDEVVAAQKFARNVHFLETRTRQAEAERPSSGATGFRILLYLGQRCWFAGVYGQLLWDLTTCLTALPFCSTSAISNQILLTTFVRLRDMSTSSTWASISLLLNWTSFWWNWRLEEEMSVHHGIKIWNHIKEMRIWYFDMLILLGFRTILHIVLQSPSLVDQSSAAPQIMHAFGFCFLALLARSAYHCPRLSNNPKIVDLHPPPFEIIGPRSLQYLSPIRSEARSNQECRVSMNSSQKRAASPVSESIHDKPATIGPFESSDYMGRHALHVDNRHLIQTKSFHSQNNMNSSAQQNQLASGDIGCRLTPSSEIKAFTYDQSLESQRGEIPSLKMRGDSLSSGRQRHMSNYGQNQSFTRRATPTKRFQTTLNSIDGYQQPHYLKNDETGVNNQHDTMPKTVSATESLHKTISREIDADMSDGNDFRHSKPRLINGYSHWTESPMFRDILKKSNDPSDRALYADIMQKQDGTFAGLDPLQSSLAEAEAQQKLCTPVPSESVRSGAILQQPRSSTAIPGSFSRNPSAFSRAANMTNKEAIDYFMTGQTSSDTLNDGLGHEPMDLDSPTTRDAYHFNPARRLTTTTQISTSTAAPSITGYNPFRTPVPAAPIGPAHRLRNPPNQPRLRVSSAETKENFFTKVMQRGHSPSLQLSDDCRREMHLAQPKFFPPSDQTFGDDLVNAFSSTKFDLGDSTQESDIRMEMQTRMGWKWLWGIVIAGVFMFGVVASKYVEFSLHSP